jgi:hypothetical protein
MENQIQEETETFPPMQFNEEIRYFVYVAAKWGKILAIIGFVFAIGGIFTASYLSVRRPHAGPAGMPQGIFILMALFHLVPIVLLYKFSNNAKNAIDHNSESEMTKAFERLKSYFKFYAIYVLITGIIGASAAAMTYAFMHR